MRLPHTVLGVASNATEEEFHSAYRRLMRELHPDKAGNDPRTAARYHEVQQAYMQYRRGLTLLKKSQEPPTPDPDADQAKEAAKRLTEPFLAGVVTIGADYLRKKTGAVANKGAIGGIAAKGAHAVLEEGTARITTFLGEYLRGKRT